MKFVSRSEWGARAPKQRVLGNLSKPSTVHWNGPKMPEVSHDRCASVVRGTQNFHMDGRGWSDIAYNFLVCVHGYVFEGRGLNVWNGANGTNTGNQTSHAVMVLVGQGNALTSAAKQAVKDAVAHVDAKTAAPGAPVIGHRDHKSTECPGDELHAWVHAGLPMAVEEKVEVPDVMFNPGTDLHGVVEEAYTKICGRKPESEETRGAWAWTLGVEQGKGYASLVSGLLYEQRLREQNNLAAERNRINEALVRIGALESAPDVVPVLTEEQILETVAAALLN